jgi:hypothetical protein
MSTVGWAVALLSYLSSLIIATTTRQPETMQPTPPVTTALPADHPGRS